MGKLVYMSLHYSIFPDSKKKISHIFEEYTSKCLSEKKLKREDAAKRHDEKMKVMQRMENLLQNIYNNSNK